MILTALLGKKTNTWYQSRIDAKKLLRLAPTKQEWFKVLLLALC